MLLTPLLFMSCREGVISETYSTAGFIFDTSGKYIFEIRDREEFCCPSIPQL
jgi:hypothetical protein